MSSEYFLVKRGSMALANRVVLDKNLSFTALGVLATLLALPPQAPKGYRALLGRGLGEKAVRNALNELVDHGFRHLFKVRIPGGRLRTLTVISDEPISADEARSVIEAQQVGVLLPPTAEVEESVQTPRSHRAAGGAARSDLHVWEAGDEVTAPRSTVPRSAVARSTTAQLAKANSKSAKADLTNQPHTGGRVGQEERAGSVLAPNGATPQGTTSPELGTEDRALLAACLPTRMQALDSVGVHDVAALLRERVDAGWSVKEILQVMDQPLPERVDRLASLVAYRLRTNVAPSLPPAKPEVGKSVMRAVAEEPVARPYEQAWDEHVWEPAFVTAGGFDSEDPSRIIAAAKEAVISLESKGLDTRRWPGFWAEAVRARPGLDPEDPEAWPDLVAAAREIAAARLEVA